MRPRTATTALESRLGAQRLHQQAGALPGGHAPNPGAHQREAQGAEAGLAGAGDRAVDCGDERGVAGALAEARGFKVQRTPEALVAQLSPRDDIRIATAALNRALVEAGIGVFSIAHKARSLEGIYREAAKQGAV